MLSYNYQFPHQVSFYKGKVRNVYELENNALIMIASDRISAFDVILPKEIPLKGAILTSIASKFLKETKNIVPNWLVSSPDPRVAIGLKCEPFKVEMVIRGYLCGHALRTFQEGKSGVCGVEFPEGIKPYSKFPVPMITPSTKASEGHDEDIIREDIISQGLVSEVHYKELERITRELFAFGQEYASQKGLILADTKYEFGLYEGQIYLMDEIHTPDSSRYFYLAGFEEATNAGKSPKQLSKEFVREWLMENNFMGKEGQAIPEMTETVVKMIQDRYLELYEVLMGERFNEDVATNDEELMERIHRELVKN